MKQSDYRNALLAELARAGVTEYEFQYGGKHPRIVFWHNGKRVMYVYPASPSDTNRGILNAVSGIRKLLGLAAPARGKSDRPPKARIRRDAPAPVLESFACADPFAKLAEWKPPSRFIWTRRTSREWRVDVVRSAAGG